MFWSGIAWLMGIGLAMMYLCAVYYDILEERGYDRRQRTSGEKTKVACVRFEILTEDGWKEFGSEAFSKWFEEREKERWLERKLTEILGGG